MADGRIVARKVTTSPTAARTAATRRTARPSTPRMLLARTRSRTSRSTRTASTRTASPASAMRGFGITMAVVRARDADGPDRASWSGSTRGDPLAQRLSQRRHQAAPQDRRGRDADRDDAGGATGRPRCALRAMTRPETRPCRAAGAASAEDADDGEAARTGMAAVNYPTGMNLGGDPSQALVHATTVGGFVVTLAATDLGQGLKHRARRRSAPRRWASRIDTVRIDTADTDTGPHAWARSPAAPRTGPATPSSSRGRRGARGAVRGRGRRAGGVDRDDLETDGEGTSA